LTTCCPNRQNPQIFFFIKQGQLNSFRQKKPSRGTGGPIHLELRIRPRIYRSVQLRGLRFWNWVPVFDLVLLGESGRVVFPPGTNRNWFEAFIISSGLLMSRCFMVSLLDARELVSAVPPMARSAVAVIVIVVQSIVNTQCFLSAMGKISAEVIVVLDNADCIRSLQTC